MRWAEVLQDKSLQDLPYKIELNERGNLELTPASNRHGQLQAAMAAQLRQQIPHGDVISECSVETAKGVKVADVAWCSVAFIKQHGFETPYTEAPELCVEILSPSNRPADMGDKVKLYFAAGAHEVWLVSEQGAIAMYDCNGPVNQSGLGVTVRL